MTTRYPLARILAIVCVGVVALALLAACGSSSDEATETSVVGSAATNVTGAATQNASAVNGAATQVSSAMTSSPVSSAVGQAQGIAECLQQNTTGDVISDLRNGDTASTQELYKTCLSSSLPPELVSQLDPIITDAATCGQQTVQALSDADLTAAQNGDQTTIQSITTDTLNCLSDKYGGLIPTS